MSHFKPSRAIETQPLAEARRVFVDFHAFKNTVSMGCITLLQNVFEDEYIPSNSATIEGILCVRDSIGNPYANIIDRHYLHNVKYADLAKEMGINVSRVGAINKRMLQLMRKRIRHFFLPERQAYLKRYNLFLEAVQEKAPKISDLSVKELNLSDRTANALYESGIFTASQMLFKPVNELMKIRDIGPLGFEEIMKTKWFLLSGKI